MQLCTAAMMLTAATGSPILTQAQNPDARYASWPCYDRTDLELTVDSDGNVVSADYRQAGSTTNDRTLIDLALEAARKAKFKRSSKFTEGGTITYKFNLN